MANKLLQALRENDAAKGKKATNYFDANASVVSYSTGLPNLDYYLGYKVNINDENGNFVKSYPSIGITAGSYVLFIGKPGVAKTSFAIKIAGHIIKPFENGTIMHFDIEGASNYSRIQALTKLSMTELAEKYVLRQEKVSLNDIKSTLNQIYQEKVHNPDKYMYDTGKLNEFGNEISIFEPTVVIIDSIATITTGLGDDKKSVEKMEEVSSQTERMRLTGEIGRFFNEILPICKEANIIVIAINQIKVNPGVAKTPSLILGLKTDEACPGGMGPLFNAQILLKFTAVTSDKYNEEDDGFSGFKINAEIIKSRVSQAMHSCSLIYDRNTGVDMLRSTVEFAKDMGFVGGDRRGYYFIENKDHKFGQRTMHEDFKNDRELYKILKDLTIPVLENQLSGINPEQLDIPEEEENFYDL